MIILVSTPKASHLKLYGQSKRGKRLSTRTEFGCFPCGSYLQQTLFVIPILAGLISMVGGSERLINIEALYMIGAFWWCFLGLILWTPSCSLSKFRIVFGVISLKYFHMVIVIPILGTLNFDVKFWGDGRIGNTEIFGRWRASIVVSSGDRWDRQTVNRRVVTTSLKLDQGETNYVSAPSVEMTVLMMRSS